MSKILRLALAALVAAGLVPSRVATQSLADVARQEEQRRKTVKEAGKTYTNRDLKPVVLFSEPPPADASAPGTAPAEKAETPAAGAKGAAAEPVKDQKYWSGRAHDLQMQLDRNQTYVDALQSRINGLTADFVNRDDPAQRAVISTDRQKALAELDRVTQSIQDDKKAMADLEEEARRAGVPPGWLR